MRFAMAQCNVWCWANAGASAAFSQSPPKHSLGSLATQRDRHEVPGRKRKYCRDPAFLLTTDLSGTPQELLQALQAYFDRWQIEVNTEKRKIRSVWARRRSGRNVRCRDSPLLPWLLTARSIWWHS